MGDFRRRSEFIAGNGMPVRLTVAALNPKDAWHKLLEIRVHPQPGFTHLASQAKVVAGYNEDNF